MIYSWKKILRVSIPILTFTIFIEILAGQILQNNIEKLYIFPIFLISIPVINGVGGNIGSILGARLASGLHVGYIKYDIMDKNMNSNFATSILIGVVSYSFLAILIYYIAYFGNIKMDNVQFIGFISIIILTGLLLVFLISIISILTAFLSFKRGMDPDDVVAPVVTTMGDTLGIILLFFIIGVVGI